MSWVYSGGQCLCLYKCPRCLQERGPPQRPNLRARCENGAHLYRSAHSRGPNGQDLFLLPVMFILLILKAQPKASCKCVSIGTRPRRGVVAMDCTGVQLKSKGPGDSGGSTERGWRFLQLPSFSESSYISSMTRLWH